VGPVGAAGMVGNAAHYVRNAERYRAELEQVQPARVLEAQP